MSSIQLPQCIEQQEIEIRQKVLLLQLQQRRRGLVGVVRACEQQQQDQEQQQQDEKHKKEEQQLTTKRAEEENKNEMHFDNVAVADDDTTSTAVATNNNDGPAGGRGRMNSAFHNLQINSSSNHPSKRKRVRFAKRHELWYYKGADYPNHGGGGTTGKARSGEEGGGSSSSSSINKTTSVMTEEITVLSSMHGRARRQLREISKFDLQSAIKYGAREEGYPCHRTGLHRWKYIYKNVVYITDHSSKKEVTSYREPIKIQRCQITDIMIKRHKQVKQILRDEPQLCATHTIILIDQSASMKSSDIDGFRNRSQAAYGILGLDFIAGQLYERGDENYVDAVTIIEMNDNGTVIINREPLDWILFNRVLDRQLKARPRSHGNYTNALFQVYHLLQRELQDLTQEEYTDYLLLFLSDGKPSDTTQQDVTNRDVLLKYFASTLGSKLTVHTLGLSEKGSDFSALQGMADTINQYGSKGHFSHTGLSSVQLSTVLSSTASAMTSLRSQALTGTGKEEEVNGNDNDNDVQQLKREEKDITCIPLYERKYGKHGSRSFKRYDIHVGRYSFDYERYKKEFGLEQYQKYPWKQIGMKHGSEASAWFEMDKIPFGKGAERLAYRFYELDGYGKQIGKMMVAKESKFVMSDEYAKLNFHSVFCRVQNKSSYLARIFNQVVQSSLQTEREFQPPKIEFVDCHVYNYWSVEDNQDCGVLVEPFLKGKFVKYNGNNGYVNKNANKSSITLSGIGDVLMTDFLQAFSHWTYEYSNHVMVLCDLQGVFNEEGRHPTFKLTDPVICSKKGERFGKTDRRINGIRSFCLTHKCNGVCKGLGLPSNYGVRSS